MSMKSPSNIIRAAQQEKRKALFEHEAKELARSVGIPLPKSAVCETTDQDTILAAAGKLGFPLALKAISPDIVHKTESGAVMLDIPDSSYLVSALSTMTDTIASRAPGAVIRGFFLETMMPPGLELLVGGLRDKQFGPSVAFGLGGIWVEALKDAVFGILPMTAPEILDMISRTRANLFLQGFRGSPPLDQGAVLSIINAVSALMNENPMITQVDLNPVRVYEKGAAVLDVRLLLD